MHCHTTVSDGDRTPAEVKEIYQSMGYSVVAYTDHDIMLLHDELTDDKFVALHGFEMEVNEETDKPWPLKKCCHLCFVALDKENDVQPMWNENYLIGNGHDYKHLVKFDKNQQPYVRTYTHEGINDMIKRGKQSGFFVTYNHPTWSLETYREYIGYKGMDAFEIFNGSCLANGFDDYNPRVYDDFLSVNKKIFCIGADDNHNHDEPHERTWDSGVAFTVIKAEKLEYNTITKALADGNFYASEGPEIYALWLEDDTVYIECSEADKIVLSCQARRTQIAYAEIGGAITKASFKLDKKNGCFRLTVTDKNGKHACTNFYEL